MFHRRSQSRKVIFGILLANFFHYLWRSRGISFVVLLRRTEAARPCSHLRTSLTAAHPVRWSRTAAAMPSIENLTEETRAELKMTDFVQDCLNERDKHVEALRNPPPVPASPASGATAADKTSAAPVPTAADKTSAALLRNKSYVDTRYKLETESMLARIGNPDLPASPIQPV